MSSLNRYRSTLGAAAISSALLLGFAAVPAQAATVAAAAAASTTTPVCVDAPCFLDVRTGAHTGYDRLVFDVTALPQIQSSSVSTSGAYDYTDERTEYVTITGQNYLFINFQGAEIYDDNGNLAYTTPSPEAIDLPSLKGVQLVNDFEGDVSFALTLGSYTKYDISTLTAPDRVVVDIYH